MSCMDILRFMTAIQRWLYGGELDDTKITRETVTPQQIVRCNVLDNYEITSPKECWQSKSYTGAKYHQDDFVI